MKSAYSSAGDVLFQWRGALSVGLTSAGGARGFEGDPVAQGGDVGATIEAQCPVVDPLATTGGADAQVPDGIR